VLDAEAPDSYDAEAAAGLNFLSAYLHLLSIGCGKVRASCDLRLVDPVTGAAVPMHPSLVAVRELDPMPTAAPRSATACASAAASSGAPSSETTASPSSAWSPSGRSPG